MVQAEFVQNVQVDDTEIHPVERIITAVHHTDAPMVQVIVGAKRTRR